MKRSLISVLVLAATTAAFAGAAQADSTPLKFSAPGEILSSTKFMSNSDPQTVIRDTVSFLNGEITLTSTCVVTDARDPKNVKTSQMSASESFSATFASDANQENFEIQPVIKQSLTATNGAVPVISNPSNMSDCTELPAIASGQSFAFVEGNLGEVTIAWSPGWEITYLSSRSLNGLYYQANHNINPAQK